MKENLKCQDFDEKYQDVEGCADIIKLIENNNTIDMITCDLSRKTEAILEFTVAAILKRYEHDHLLSALYTSLKEILVNATRANAKVAFFNEIGLDIHNPDDFKKGTELIKGLISEEWIEKYGALAKKEGYETNIKFSFDEKGVRLEIINVALKPEEEKRIREKLSQGMKYDNLMAFYMDHADQTEGEGMGLAMILVLLKGENINPNLFRMGIVDDRTLSRLEIPFSDEFISVRGKNPAGKQAG